MLIEEDPQAYRVVGRMTGADAIMNEALFVGVYPGLTTRMMDYIIDVVTSFVKEARR
jgi:CDP-6-deoxy-D-xylo-4-hexulose-3-dehydrase